MGTLGAVEEETWPSAMAVTKRFTEKCEVSLPPEAGAAMSHTSSHRETARHLPTPSLRQGTRAQCIHLSNKGKTCQ